MFNYQQRVTTAQELMHQVGISALLVSAPADLLYLIGYNFHASERLTLLIIPRQGSPSIVMPQFEASRLTAAQGFLKVHPGDFAYMCGNMDTAHWVKKESHV